MIFLIKKKILGPMILISSMILSLQSFQSFSLESFSLENLAQYIQLQSGDAGLSPIKGQLASADSLCPNNARCITNGTKVEISFNLYGCLDRLGPVSHKAVHQSDGTVDIFISALNIHNKKSWVAFCDSPPKASYRISFVNKFYDKEDARLHFLGVQN